MPLGILKNLPVTMPTNDNSAGLEYIHSLWQLALKKMDKFVWDHGSPALKRVNTVRTEVPLSLPNVFEYLHRLDSSPDTLEAGARLSRDIEGWKIYCIGRKCTCRGAIVGNKCSRIL